MNGDNSGLVLVGIGGGGCRLAAAARRAYGEGMQAIGFDTDEAANRAIEGLRCQLLGATRLNKQGAGGVHSSGRLAAQDDLPSILNELRDARIVVAVTCLGGGTGGGAAPVILKALRAEGKVTLCFATLPFAFEGSERRQNAERDRPFIEQASDTVVLVPMDELHEGLTGATVADAGAQAGARLASGLCVLWRLLFTPGYIRLDPARLQNMLISAGNARFGRGSADGEGRAEAAVAALGQSRLLRGGEALASARAVALGVLAGPDLRLAEIGCAMDSVRALCRKEARIEMGVALDARFDGRIELVALAFETWSPVERRRDRGSGDQSGDLLGRDAGRDAKLGVGSGKFRGVEKTVHKGEDLDMPTYQRWQIRLER